MLLWQCSRKGGEGEEEGGSPLSRFYLGFRESQRLCLHKVHRWKPQQYTKGGCFRQINHVMRTISSQSGLISLQRSDETCLLSLHHHVRTQEESTSYEVLVRHWLYEHLNPELLTLPMWEIYIGSLDPAQSRGIFLVIPAANGPRERSWFGPSPSAPSSSLSNCSVWVAGRPGSPGGALTLRHLEALITQQRSVGLLWSQAELLTYSLPCSSWGLCHMVSRFFPREAINLNVKLSAFGNWINRNML